DCYHVEGLFNRPAVVNVAAKVAGNWDDAVIADADAWSDPAQLDKDVRQARQTGKLVSTLNAGWMLSAQQTATILSSASVPTSVSRPPERKTDPTMTQSICLLIPRAVFEAIGGLDEGYRGWGAEDNALWHAATIAAGKPERTTGPAYHMHHPPASTREERSE